MIRTIESKLFAAGENENDFKYYKELAGASADTKPTTGLVTGSLFLEADTGNVYVYDETSSDWTQIGG